MSIGLLVDMRNIVDVVGKLNNFELWVNQKGVWLRPKLDEKSKYNRVYRLMGTIEQSRFDTNKTPF
jgi:hypothetical protein